MYLNTIVPIVYIMESLELVTNEFLKEKKTLEEVGYEVVGTKYDSKDNLYLVRKKKQ